MLRATEAFGHKGVAKSLLGLRVSPKFVLSFRFAIVIGQEKVSKQLTPI